MRKFPHHLKRLLPDPNFLVVLGTTYNDGRGNIRILEFLEDPRRGRDVAHGEQALVVGQDSLGWPLHYVDSCPHIASPTCGLKKEKGCL